MELFVAVGTFKLSAPLCVADCLTGICALLRPLYPVLWSVRAVFVMCDQVFDQVLPQLQFLVTVETEVRRIAGDVVVLRLVTQHVVATPKSFPTFRTWKRPIPGV